MSRPGLAPERWQTLIAVAEDFTCYSAAVAVWSAVVEEDWGRAVNPGFALTITDEAEQLLGFAYFPSGLRAELGLARTGADTSEDAIDGVMTELARSGRVIVAGDGFALPWHVAYGRVHAPHWFVLIGDANELEVADPFACRNELGLQQPTRHGVERGDLPQLLAALPGDNAVHELREILALGDETHEALAHRYQWFVRRSEVHTQAPQGVCGPDGIARLARHFREHGQDPAAYAQVDDIWSIGRHRAFLLDRVRARCVPDGDAGLESWVAEHGEPLVKRWAHVAPLLMQARLSLAAGRPASDSVPRTLEDLAARERAAAQAFPSGLDPGTI